MMTSYIVAKIKFMVPSLASLFKEELCVFCILVYSDILLSLCGVSGYAYIFSKNYTGVEEV